MLKKKIIKWLGGYTQEEMEEYLNNGVEFGYRHAITTVFEFVKSCNGMSEHDWINAVWTYISTERKDKIL